MYFNKHTDSICKNLVWYYHKHCTAHCFPLRISSVNVIKLQISADLVTFTEEIRIGKPHFLYNGRRVFRTLLNIYNGVFSLFWNCDWSYHSKNIWFVRDIIRAITVDTLNELFKQNNIKMFSRYYKYSTATFTTMFAWLPICILKSPIARVPNLDLQAREPEFKTFFKALIVVFTSLHCSILHSGFDFK